MVILYILFVGSIVNLCTCCYSIPPASRARSNVHEALGGAFPKRHHVDCGLNAIICKVPILGRHMMWIPRDLAPPLHASKTRNCLIGGPLIMKVMMVSTIMA
jgi:hypothetical protein